MKLHDKVVTKEELGSFRAKLHRRQLIVYFYTGILPGDHSPHYALQASSSSITPSTIFVCQQSLHRS